MTTLNEILVNKKKSCKSIWFMRQAGRYLPEFREIRKKNQNFIELCLNSSLSSEITLQPIKRFNLDSAIIFSDILLVPYALGQKVDFIQNRGPLLSNFNSKFFFSISEQDFIKQLKPVYNSISMTREKLQKEKSLISFVGAPWTLLIYMFNLKTKEGKINFTKIKEKESLSKEILDKLVKFLCIHIEKQIEAGADTVQIFDSWAGLLPEEYLKSLCYSPNLKITEFCKSKKIPIICFPKGINKNYKKFADFVKPDGISLDYEIDPIWAKQNLTNVVLQGGLNPKILLESDDIIYAEAKKYLDIFKDVPYIFNLGHGLTPETDPEKLRKLIEFVRGYK